MTRVVFCEVVIFLFVSVSMSSCGLFEDSENTATESKGPMAVVFHLDGDLPQFPGSGGILAGVKNNQYRLENLLDRAAFDVQVREVVIHIASPTLGLARAEQLGSVISRFEKSGKPISCHLESVDNISYYLAARYCPSISIAPAGSVDLIGLSMEAVYAKDLLDSIGVSADIIHMGKYKDAGETLTRSDMSPESEEASKSLLNSLNENFLDSIAEGRKLEREKIVGLVDSGPFDAEDALSNQLVDSVSTIGEISSTLKDKYVGGVTENYGEEPRKQFSFADLMSLLSGSAKTGEERPVHDRIALIPVVGPIVGGTGQSDLLSNMEVVSDNALVMALEDAKRDKSVKAVVLAIDSPGGSALASDNIWVAVRSVAKVKPVIASLGNVAASGGYYIASASTEIISSADTLTGSIGVIGGKLVLGDGLRKIGVNSRLIKMGKHSAMSSPFQPFDEDERASITKLMQKMYDLFVDRVTEGRKIERGAVLEHAQGRVWTGKQALEFGLIDSIGTLRDAVEKASKLSNSTGAPLEIFPPPKSFMELLTDELSEPSSIALSYIKQVPTGAKAMALVAMLEKNTVLAYSPTLFEIR